MSLKEEINNMGTSSFQDSEMLESPLVKELLICTVCSEFLDNAHVLPCQHSFCLKCLETMFEERQAATRVRLGSLRCPSCKVIVAIPLGGVSKFPQDVKVEKIRDLVDQLILQKTLNKSMEECQSEVGATKIENNNHVNNGFSECNGFQDSQKSFLETCEIETQTELLGDKIQECLSGKSAKTPSSFNDTCNADGHFNFKTMNGTEASVGNPLSPNPHGFCAKSDDNPQNVDNSPSTDAGAPGINGVRDNGSTYDGIDGVEGGTGCEAHTDTTDGDQDGEPPKDMLYNPAMMWKMERMEYDMPTGIAFTSEGSAVVAEYGNGKLNVFSREGIFEVSVQGLKPYSVAVDNENHIIVADRKSKTLHVMDTTGQGVVDWEPYRFGWVSGIAITNDYKYVIAERERCKIGIFEPDGAQIHEFGNHGENDTQFSMADFLAVDSHNRIIVCDSANHSIKLYDVQGRFLGKFGGRGTSDGRLLWPKSVCVDDKDNILVADTRNNRVSMFSPDGQFMEHVLQNWTLPFALGYQKQDQLLGVTHHALSGYSYIGVYCLNG